jgi:hypothetical protein
MELSYKQEMGSGVPAGEVARHCNMPNPQMGWYVDEHPHH